MSSFINAIIIGYTISKKEVLQLSNFYAETDDLVIKSLDIQKVADNQIDFKFEVYSSFVLEYDDEHSEYISKIKNLAKDIAFDYIVCEENHIVTTEIMKSDISFNDETKIATFTLPMIFSNIPHKIDIID